MLCIDQLSDSHIAPCYAIECGAALFKTWYRRILVCIEYVFFSTDNASPCGGAARATIIRLRAVERGQTLGMAYCAPHYRKDFKESVHVSTMDMDVNKYIFVIFLL